MSANNATNKSAYYDIISRTGFTTIRTTDDANRPADQPAFKSANSPANNATNRPSYHDTNR